MNTARNRPSLYEGGSVSRAGGSPGAATSGPEWEAYRRGVRWRLFDNRSLFSPAAVVPAHILTGMGVCLWIVAAHIAPVVLLHTDGRSEARALWPAVMPGTVIAAVVNPLAFVATPAGVALLTAGVAWWVAVLQANPSARPHRLVILGAALGAAGAGLTHVTGQPNPLLPLVLSVAVAGSVARTSRRNVVYAVALSALIVPAAGALARSVVDTAAGQAPDLFEAHPLWGVHAIVWAGPYACCTLLSYALAGVLLARFGDLTGPTRHRLLANGVLALALTWVIRVVWQAADSPSGHDSTLVWNLYTSTNGAGVGYDPGGFTLGTTIPFPPTSWWWALVAAPGSGTPLDIVAGLGWVAVAAALARTLGSTLRRVARRWSLPLAAVGAGWWVIVPAASVMLPRMGDADVSWWNTTPGTCFALAIIVAVSTGVALVAPALRVLTPIVCVKRSARAR